MLYLALCLAVVAVNLVTSTEYGIVTYETNDGGTVNMDISLDKTTMLSYPWTPVPKPKCFTSTVNFHDFKKGLVAMKAVGEGKCYVKPTSENYNQQKKLIRQFKQGRTKPVKQALETWEVPTRPLPTYQLKSKVGRKIIKFCTGYSVYELNGQTVLKSVNDLPRVSKKTGRKLKPFCWWSCGSCKAVYLEQE